jgi:hypothetical protein
VPAREERNLGAAPFFLTPLPGLALADAAAAEAGVLVRLDDVVDVLVEVAVSPTPPSPPAVMGTGIGLPAESRFAYGPRFGPLMVATDWRFQLYCLMSG